METDLQRLRASLWYELVLEPPRTVSPGHGPLGTSSTSSMSVLAGNLAGTSWCSNLPGGSPGHYRIY